MKKLLPILILLFVFASCKKDDNFINPPAITPVQKEDSTITVPPFSATMTANGSKRTINIVGGLTYIKFAARVPIPNDPRAQFGFKTFIFDLKYDKVDVTSIPRNFNAVYTFVRNSPYNYTFMHDVIPNETYSIIVNGQDFFNDTIEFKY
ncbi:hypothetical protein [Pedobacter arcticus]|uniref:hypothetical protein n=1 Tax=Pedobacter arcticus TaxID=752140 RepID=UPI00031C6FFA|nr:hypothetical protein [Pedobacter arcticus]